MDKKIDYKKLRDFRVDKDFKQKEIAAMLNIVPSAYSRIERGERGLRVEQLKIIAEMLGKNINEFFKEKELNNNINNGKIMEGQVELLESIVCMISADIEEQLFRMFYKYEQVYPTIPFPYEEYIKGNHVAASPDDAISEIKDLVKGYAEFKENPIVWYKKTEQEEEQRSKEMGMVVERNERKKDEEVEISDYLFSQFFGKEEYEMLKDKSDEELREFVTKEENYDFIWCLLNWVHYQKPEDLYRAFKDMMRSEPIICTLFQYGLLEGSWFSDLWGEYSKEINLPSSAIAHAAKGNIVRRVSDTMWEIFSRRNRSDYYLGNSELQ